MSRANSTAKKPAPAPAATKEKKPATPATRTVPAVRRACASLWFLSRHPEGLPLSRIARELEMIPSTCLHILRELAVGHLVAYDPNTKLYRLGSGVLSLGKELAQQNPFVQLAQPQLNRLSRDFDVGASAQERVSDSELLVVASASILPGDIVSAGGRIPLFSGASGRLMAAFNPFTEAQLRQRFGRAPWQMQIGYEQWRAEVRTAAHLGWAADEGHFRKGVTVIAVPVLNEDGTTDRAVSVTAISAQLDPARRKQILAALQKVAGDIGDALG